MSYELSAEPSKTTVSGSAANFGTEEVVELLHNW